MLNISAIDVGSNAMRMVIGEVDENWRVNTIENIRLPVRLSEDVFRRGYLEQKTIQQMEEALLCLADSLDISHMGNVTDVTLRGTRSGWRMKLPGRNDQMLVNWAFDKRQSRFKEVFGVNLEMD